MANTFAVSRSHLIYGVCLPLAVLVGYLLASPLESSSIAVVVLVLSVLSIPILMRWHHPLLIISWNAVISPAFLPGNPYLWSIMAGLSLFFSLLNRSLGHNLNFFRASSVSKSLIFFGIVVLATASLTGGIGVRALGAASFGGKKYFYIFAAIAGYFALASQNIPRNRAGLYVSLFFLAGLTSLVNYLAIYGGRIFSFIPSFFPVDVDAGMAAAGPNLMGMEVFRMMGFAPAAIGIICFLLARYGVQGLFELRKPWRSGLFFLGITASLYAGFRSNMALFAGAFFILFYLEGLFRTRYFLIIMLVGALTGAALLPNLHKLPLSVQRSLSFLPINVDPLARESAEGSTVWRVEMWKDLIPQVPRYLIKGKGYSLSPDELFMVMESSMRGYARSSDEFELAGDYHNGPLSLIIPFGIGGVIGFCWFLIAAVKVLHQNYRFGDSSLRQINTFLFAYFVVRICFFLFVFGSTFSDLFIFTGLVGLSVSLNGGVCRPSNQLSEAVSE
ncbi:MAG: O-Antigen ligase [Pedosphaera sp.]|nr:O-Antigen ligase [Pedosphaera sp.]